MSISLREQVALALVGALLVAAWILAVTPERARARRLGLELAQLDSQVQSAERAMEALAATERELREGQERLRRVQERILEKRDLRRILTLLSRETQELGIRIVSVRPLEERAAAGDTPTRQLPVELELQGRFLDLGRYLEGLQAAPVLFTVEGVRVIRADKASRLTMRMVAVAHIRPQGP